MGEELVGPEVFDEDYLWFMEAPLEERSDAEVELIVRLLDLPAGAAVLDAPCGHGRIANRLAARGFEVVGLERNRAFLALARERASEAGVSVEYVEGDLRELPFERRFDAVVNWFTSFGYFDEAGNRRVLDGFGRALKPGGALLIEQASRDFLLSNLPASGQAVWMSERGDDLLIDKVTFDERAARSNTERIIVRNGRVRRTGFSLSQPTVEGFRAMLGEAGFTDVRALGEAGEDYTARSRRLLMLARTRSSSRPAGA